MAAAAQAFEVIRGTAVILADNTSITLTEGTDYTLPSGATSSNCLVRITNTRLAGMGPTSGNANRDLELFGVWVDDASEITSQIKFERYAFGAGCRVTYEILCFVGIAGGRNEFVVRETAAVAVGLTPTTDIVGATVSTIVDSSDVAVIITGQGCDISNRNEWHSALFVSELEDLGGGDYRAKMVRGTSTHDDATVSYAIVEWVGSNWTVTRESFTTEASVWAPGDSVGSLVTLGTSVASVAKTLFFPMYSTDNDNTGVDDAGDAWVLESTTQWRLYNRTQAGVRTKAAWVLQNSQASSDARNLNVQHELFADDTVTGSSERTFTHTFGSTLTAPIAQSSVICCCSIDGTSNGTPRGSIDYTLLSTTQVQFREHNFNQERRIGVQVVEWPEDEILTGSGNETATITESVSYGAGYGRGASDSASIVESIRRGMGFGRGAGETVGIIEAVRAGLGFGASSPETAAITEGLAAALGFTRSHTETAAILDAVAARTGQIANRAEVAAITESVSAAVTLAVGPYEDMHNDVRSRVKAVVQDGLSVPLWWPNGKRTPVQDAVWGEVVIQDDETKIMSFAVGTMGIKYRKHGTLRIILRHPLNRGDQALLSLADSIRPSFRHQTVAGTTYGIPWLENGRRDDVDDGFGNVEQLWRHDVVVPFWNDDNQVPYSPVTPATRPDMEAVHSACRTRFNREVAIPQGTTVVYDNDPTEPPQDQQWVHFSVQTGRGDPPYGIGKSARVHIPGVAHAMISTPLGRGTQQALALADAIVLPFRSVHESGVNFGLELPPRLVTVGRVGERWQTNVQIPFVAEEVT